MKRSETSTRLKAPGLPAGALFQHLEKYPVANKITTDFLKQNVWWWRLPDLEILMWVQGASEGWPKRGLLCELFSLYPPERRPQTLDEAQDEAVELLKRYPEHKHNLCCQHDQDIDAAKGYELEARDKGAYPCGVPYLLLTRAQRDKWVNTHWQLNLNSIPAILEDDGTPPDFGPEKMTVVFCAGLGHFKTGSDLRVRFNLRHGDGWLVREFKQLIADRRNRLRIFQTEELQRKDPVLIRDCRQFITKERKRLRVPNPKHEGQDRRPLKRSWADVENIDIKTHCKFEAKTTSCTRQRESVTRRKLAKQRRNRWREIANWKLTILKTRPPRGSVTGAKL